MVTLCRRVDILLKETPVGEALEAVSEKDCNELFQYYLHDFVRSVHRSHHSDLSLSDKEYKVIMLYMYHDFSDFLIILIIAYIKCLGCTL